MFTLASFTGFVFGWSLVSEKHANFVAYLFIFNERGGYSRLLQYSIGGGDGGLSGNKEDDDGGSDDGEVDGAHIKSALLVLELVFIIVQRIVETSSARCVVLLL